MIVPFDCPNCNHVLQVELKGLKRKVVMCPSCDKETQLPDDLGIGPGVTIGDGYKLDNKIGESHLGDIYLATKESDNRSVRIEILSGSVTSDEEAVTRFLNEIELLRSLKHKNLLPYIEAGQDNQTYFLVTANEPGMTLEERLRKEGAVDEKSALSYLVSVAEVLRYTWDDNDRKLLHRDIKPQNIYITEDNKAKLTGFGIAKSSDGQSLGLTGVGFTIGTPEYMSPEQIKASENLDFKSDLYGLGVVMYEMLAGELPFIEDAPILLMQKHMDEIPVPLDEKTHQVSKPCSNLVDRMLEKNPDDRHQSWNELIEEAKAILNSEVKAPTPSSAPRPTSSEREFNTPRPSNSNQPIIVALIVIGGIILILILIKVLGFV